MEEFFKNIVRSGSVAGWISHLIYHSDMVDFYNDFYDDIKEIQKKIEDITGKPVETDNRIHSFFAHLSFDETAKEIAGELGLELEELA